ncbi:MAG: inorganic diphosphatase [Bacilli bacterium]|nr:inorganic diphosphatase [Bacilli bacterium]MDY6430873.1 inorganic diphosphatase [Bacilli bacterium]
MNILHSIDRSKIQPDHFYACIEIPAGSSNKYEIDHETGCLVLDRVLYTATHYPHNYGFIPRTWGNDEDPLDVLVICSAPLVPLALCRCYPIGILSMNDSGESDSKIIAICENDPLYNSFKDIKDLPPHVFDEIEHFFKHYKELENFKDTVIEGIHGVEKAKSTIKRAIKRYEEKFPEYL